MNYWFCEVGPQKNALHEWRYFGKQSQMYVCTWCHVSVIKVALKANTDNKFPGSPDLAEVIPS